jgi:hypothetical protein
MVARETSCRVFAFRLISAGIPGLRQGISMADHGAPKYSTAAGNDYEQHEQTYEGFLTLVKYGTLAVVVILIGMFIFLT